MQNYVCSSHFPASAYVETVISRVLRPCAVPISMRPTIPVPPTVPEESVSSPSKECSHPRTRFRSVKKRATWIFPDTPSGLPGPSSQKRIKEENEEIDESNHMEDLLSFAEVCDKAVKYEDDLADSMFGKVEKEEHDEGEG
ncbi:hypothetical protein PFISCL1PPCAC_21553 [Pristionchus fissidentatus]|uniref:Uncharacterized protein n=1 Tax=Pristionchus fissidentatus TaxID=1538716 RepID=A0AAV5WDA8_9BILA|nr:hypothetical protein PFISCL1PPCAC_21553 [Pristionchus fissidentatus]